MERQKIVVICLLSIFATALAEHYTYCIEGGGASGSAAAVILKDLNISFIVHESRPDLGGHCDTVRFPGGWNEAGVIVYPDSAYANSKGYGPHPVDSVAYVKRFAGPNSVIPTFFSGIPNYIMSIEDSFYIGAVPPQPGMTPEQLFHYQRYKNLMNTTYRWMDTMLDVPKRLPQELCYTMNQWIAANNFTSIYSLFVSPLYFGGFGSFDKLTAAVGLPQRTLTNLMYDEEPDKWFSVQNGCQSLYEGIYQYIGSNVRTNAVVERIRRSHSRVRVSGTTPNGRFSDTCNYLIITMPPTLENLEPMDLTDREYDLFSQVKTRSLFVGSYDISGGILGNETALSLVNVGSTGLPTFPTVLLSFRKFGGKMVFQAFSEDDISTADMRTLVSAKLQNITNSGAYGTVSNLQLWSHNYNPHFPAETLCARKSPLYKIKKMQGRNRTLYFGAITLTPSTVPIIGYVKQELLRHIQNCP